MDSLWLAIFALGVAGMDPVGALLGIAALSSGAKRVFVVLYGALILVVTITVGTIVSLTTATISIDIDWSFPWISDTVWAIGQLIVGGGLLIVGIKRLRSRVQPEKSAPGSRMANPFMLIGTGLLFGITAPTDPTFLGVAALAGKTENLFAIVAAHTGWIILSQLPLVVFVTAVALNKHHRVIGPIEAGWTRIKPIFSHTITGIVSAAGAYLLVETGWWMSTGQWLPFWY